MSKAESAFTILIGADPYPIDSAPHPEAWSETALLEEIRARRSTMDTVQMEPTTVPVRPPNRRRAALIAAAAFTVVLGVVGVAAILQPGDDGDVTETSVPATTTTIAPSTTTAQSTTTEPTPTTESSFVPPPTTAEPEENVTLPEYPFAEPHAVNTIAVTPEGEPGALAIGPDDRIYLGTWDDLGRIYRVDTDGTVELWAQSDNLQEAYAAAFGPDGRLYVTSFGRGSLIAFDQDGTPSVITDQLSEPTGILFTPDGRLLVADAGPNSIREVLDDGSVVDFQRHDFFWWPTQMTMDADGNVYVGNLQNGRLQAIDPSGNVTELHDFDDELVGLAYVDGALYVGGWGLSIIYKYELDTGSVTLVAGTGRDEQIDGVGGEASLAKPDMMAVGPNGEIYFAQFGQGDGIALSVLTLVE